MTKLETLMERDGRDCHYCGRPLNADITREHVVPQALGGPTRLDNLVLAHAKCNRQRGHRNEEHPGCDFCAEARAKYGSTTVGQWPSPPPEPNPEVMRMIRERYTVLRVPWEDANSTYPGPVDRVVGRDMLRKAGEWPGQQRQRQLDNGC